MRKFWLRRLLLLAIVFAGPCWPLGKLLAQEDVQGLWLGKESVLQVTLQDQRLNIDVVALTNPIRSDDGFVAWSLDAPLRDVNNTEPELRRRPLLGLRIVSAAVPRGELWRGQVYDPESGNVYKVQIRVKATSAKKETLILRGYVGSPMFGRSEAFNRFDACDLAAGPVFIFLPTLSFEQCARPQAKPVR